MNPARRLYSYPLSGHSHRARLMLSLLDLPFELVLVDLPSRAHKQPEFLQKNPLGQVPVLEDGDVVLADSNAILVYLATRYDRERTWLPAAAEPAAQVQRWLSIAAGQLVQGPANARVIHVFKGPLDEQRAHQQAASLFTVQDRELVEREFLVGTRPTIADVALYTYTAHAPEGGISLAPYPHIRAWLQRIEALPRFIAMQPSPLPALTP